jgi:hypothetical protein
LCQDWSLEVSRYGIERNSILSFELFFNLCSPRNVLSGRRSHPPLKGAQLLPAAPTADRDFFKLFTAFHEPSRTFYVVAAGYPEKEVDTIWAMVISDDVTSAEQKFNLTVARPSPNDDGLMFDEGLPDDYLGRKAYPLVRVLHANESGLLAVFVDGRVTRIDLENVTHSRLAKLPMRQTDAHVVDGGILKSFVVDDDFAYLVTTDLATGTVSQPLLIKPLDRIESAFYRPMTPIACHMMKDPTSGASKLVLLMQGDADYIAWLDESTGDQEIILDFKVGLDFGSPDAVTKLYCDANAEELYPMNHFDCDFWTTSAVNANEPALYLQAHQTTIDAVEWAPVATMFKIGWDFNETSGNFDMYSIALDWPGFTYGHAGYQSIPFNNSDTNKR